MQDEWTLDSLFDGIGVFPLAGSYHNISPIFASEIEVDAIDTVSYTHLDVYKRQPPGIGVRREPLLQNHPNHQL